MKTPKGMPIPIGHKANFETLERAFDNGDAALLSCTDKATGLPVCVLCAVMFDGAEYEFVPIAKMFDGNPYDELNPPA